MLRPISIYSIPPSRASYQTVGNWEHKARHDEVTCAEIGGDPHSVRLVQLHEFVEMILCDHANISEQSVTDFDVSHPELDEPGDDPRAPYFDQHAIAMKVERIVCEALGLSWEEHEENVAKIADAVDIVLQSKTNDSQSQ